MELFLILSIVSWVLLLITEFIGLILLGKYHAIWTFWKISISENHPWPLQMHESFEYIVFIILFIITIIAFCFYIKKSFIDKDSIIIDGITGQFVKYHFIPLTCASVLFIIGYFKGNCKNDDDVKILNIFGLIFVIIGLISLIFIYIKKLYLILFFLVQLKKGFIQF